jgi:hypothetical protein
MSRPPSASIFRSPRKTNSSFFGIRPSRLQKLSGGTTQRAGAFLALFAIIATIFYAGTSSAASPSAKSAPKSSPADSSRTAGADFDFGAWLLPAMMFQPLGESVNIYAADCSTPKTDFNLGDTVCVRASFPSAFLSFRRITWIDPSNHILDSAIVTSNTQTDLFTLPATATSQIGGVTVDNRGTWRIDLRSFGGSRRATASFDVHEPANPIADLQIFAGTGDDTVAPNSTVPVKIVVYNAGPDTATNIQVSAPSVTGLSLQSFNQGAADCGGTCTVASLAPRSHSVFVATYNVTASAGTSVSAQATVTSDTQDPRLSSNSDTFSFSVAAGANPVQTCTLTAPSPITVNGSDIPDPNDPSETLYGAIVTYAVGAEGEGCAPVQCDVPSGELFPVGTTTVTCTAASGEFVIFPVTVNDTRSFRINLNGANPLTVECNSIPPFADPGATTNKPGITPTAVSTVNPNAPGSYTITYTATDDNGTPGDTSDDIVATPVVRNVTVVDDSPPHITLNDDNPLTPDEVENETMTIECHTAFVDAGATANDACDGPVPVSVSGSVNPNVVGTYAITYTATDDHGTPGDPTDDLIATVVRTVNVVDTTKPVIALNSANPLTVECHTAFNDPVTATDTCAGDLTSEIQVSGTVDPNTVGTYTLTYNVSDASGNAATTVTRTVNVVDTTAPVIECPADIVVYLPANSVATSMPVNFNVTATDSCSTTATVTTSHASGSTFSVGTTTVNATATDPSGNTSTCSFNVSVRYLFTGFFSPISNLPTVNTVKAGSAIPIKFSLSGNKGLNIFAVNSPASGQIACNSNDPAVDLTEIDTPGASGLTYNAGSDQYHYNWKTLKAWENTCRQLVVTLNDGTEHRANFKFK